MYNKLRKVTRLVGPAGRLLLVAAILVPAFALIPPPTVAAQGNAHSIEVLHVIPNGVTPTPGIAANVPATLDAVQEFLAADIGRTLRITSGVTQHRVANGSMASIRGQLETAGFDDPNTIYLIFADTVAGREGCGVTSGRYAFVLMPVCDIYPGIGAQTFPFNATYLVLHELLHALGAVPGCAPNNGNGGHVLDSNRDVLWGGPSGRDWNNLTIDVGNDDYYGHSNAGCPDLDDSPYWQGTVTAASPCDSLVVTIDMNSGASGIGTAGDDVILGTPGADTIDGMGGNDTICAGGGDDMVQGNDGDDLIYGEAGDDKLFGAQGADEIRGGDGADTMHGNRGADRLFGDAGDDRIFGYSENDIIRGGDGDDRLHGNFGDDDLHGQAGNDRVFGYGDNDTLNGGLGADVIGGNFGDDILSGDGGNDRLYGSDGADVVSGGDGNDVVEGNSGDDVINGDAGNDTLDGGINTDTCNGGAGFDTATRCETTTTVP